MAGRPSRAALQRLRTQIAESPRLLAVRLLARASKPLTVAWVIDLLATAILPNVVLVAMGVMVGRIPPALRDGMDSSAGSLLVTSFVFVGVSFAASMLVGPFHQFISTAIKVKLTFAMQSRLMSAVSRPVGIAHLEDPAVLDKVAMSQGTLMTFWPADAPATLAVVWANRLLLLTGCALVATFRWWLGLGLFAFWTWVRRPILRVIREHVQAFGGNADVMRRAFYFLQLATRPEAAKEIRIFGLGSWVVDRFRTHWMEGMAEVWKIRSGIYAVVARVGVLVFCVYLVVCGVIAWAAIEGQIGLRTIAILLPVLAMTMIYGAVQWEDLSLEWMLASLPQLDELEDELPKRTKTLPGTIEPSALPQNEIRFEGVGFGYPGATSAVFESLDVTIPAGRSTAIVGANGAGKTTLVKLLARLHDPTNGRITADGTDIAQLLPAQWQRRVAVVFQDFTRLPLSAADNIGLGKVEHQHDRDGIVASAQRAGARTFIETLPSGWDTILSREFTGGADISGGQWQRTALARALFAARHGASILVLDEPTAWMDVRGEAEFFEQFLEISQGLTTVIISHRFSTVRLADNICVIVDGRVVEQGSHAVLIELGGHYARMFALQASRFTEEPVPQAQG